MTKINLAIIYYSSTGTNYKLATAAAEGARSLGAEGRVHRVPELAPEEAIAPTPNGKHTTKRQKIPFL